MMVRFNFPFIDLTSSIDASDYMYIDFSHLSHKGNEKVAENLIFKLKVSIILIRANFNIIKNFISFHYSFITLF